MHARMSGGIGKEGGIVRLLTGCLQDEMHQGLKEHRDTQSTCNAGHQPCPPWAMLCASSLQTAGYQASWLCESQGSQCEL